MKSNPSSAAATSTKSKLTESYDVSFNSVPTTAFGLRCFTGDLDAVQQKIKEGIDWAEEETYPLEAAVYAGHQDIVESLLAAGSPVSGQILYIAYRFGGNAPVFELVKKEMKSPLEEDRANLILLDAARACDLQTVEYVLSKGADVDATDYFYGFELWTALHHAAANFQLDLITLLIEHGASVNVRNQKQMTPLRLCARYRTGVTRAQRRSCVEYLQLHGGELGEPISWLSNMKLRYGLSIFM